MLSLTCSVRWALTVCVMPVQAARSSRSPAPEDLKCKTGAAKPLIFAALTFPRNPASEALQKEVGECHSLAQPNGVAELRFQQCIEAHAYERLAHCTQIYPELSNRRAATTAAPYTIRDSQPTSAADKPYMSSAANTMCHRRHYRRFRAAKRSCRSSSSVEAGAGDAARGGVGRLRSSAQQ